MATRSKTIQYAFPVLASLVNNTLTNFTQITVYIPESSVTIKKAWVEISMDDIITVTGGTLTTKTINLRLGAAGYTSTTNGNTFSHSGENISYFTERDFTSHFTTNWTGTSMTCDVQLQINQSTGTTTGMVNVCCILNVTYEYDDTSATHIKTVWIPLNAPVTTLPTTKTSHDTIPNLDTYLPEASKTYRNIFIVTQANANQANTTDHTVTYELSSLGTHVTGNYEAALASDRWTRYVWNITSYITTNTTHTFNVHSSLTARHHSMQAWMVVTYEFSPGSTTSVMNSLIIPMGINSPMGGTTSGEYQRNFVEFFVQEPNVTLNKLACFVFWQNSGSDTGLNARVGTGSFIAYTNTGSGSVAGNKGMMIRNDSPTGITFARGRNKLTVDTYNTSTTIRDAGIGAFWIINYTSDKHTLGVGAHNHTVLWPLRSEGTEATAQFLLTAAVAPSIPETNYYISALGFATQIMNNGTVHQGVSIKTERLSGEGGLILESLYSAPTSCDAEAGLNSIYYNDTNLFRKYPQTANTGQLLLTSGRRHILQTPAGAQMITAHVAYINYHTITYSVSGNITNGTTGTTTIDLHRYSDGEKLLTTTRSGTGSYSFTWFDNTEPVYTVAYQNNTYKGRSGTGIAS